MSAADSQGGHVFVDVDKNGVETWYAEWRDHANRLMFKRLGKKSEIKTARSARRIAAGIAEKIIRDHAAQLERKHSASTRETWEASQRASFPREVVAARVVELTDRIARTELDDERRAGRPGVQLFSERTGISPRQVHRILEDETYVMVGTGIVDKICCQFEDLFDDFIASSTDWADQRGDWKERPGTEDSWPFGYESSDGAIKKPGSSPKSGQDEDEWLEEVWEYKNAKALKEMFG